MIGATLPTRLSDPTPCTPTFDQELLLWLGDEPLAVRFADAERVREDRGRIRPRGPGLMEAANRGARDASALSVGCDIELPHEGSARSTSCLKRSR